MRERKLGYSTRLKLDEAKFFFDFLAPNFKKERKFDFYLSAFISSARSVTWVMVSEYGEVPGWREWYDEMTPSEEIERLLRGATDVRNRVQKRGGLSTMKRIGIERVEIPDGDLTRLAPMFKAAVGGKLPAKLVTKNGKLVLEIEKAGLELNVSGVMVERVLDEFPGEDILQVCMRYYAFLATLVDTCEGKFGGK